MTSDPSRHRTDGAPRSVLTRIRTTVAATCALAVGGIAALLVGISNEVSADADTDSSTSTSTPLEDTTSSETTSSDGASISDTSGDTTPGSTESGTSTPTAESSVSADDSDSEPVGGSNGS